MNWVLVLFVHAGMAGGGITNVPGFKTEAACVAAGKQSESLVSRTTKDIRFVCLKQD